MSAPLKFIFVSLLAACCSAAVAQPQARSAESRHPALQKHYDDAERFQNAGDSDRAAGEYRAFLADALGELAAGREHAGDYKRAAAWFEDAAALVPDFPSLRLESARAALLAGDFPRAQMLAAALIQDNSGDSHALAVPALAQAHQILGRALLKMNQDQDARKELEKAVALDPGFDNGYALAVACLDLDDQKCAVQLFNEMQASFGDRPALHMAFGRAYGNSDFAPRAITEFKKAIAENPRYPGAHYCLAAALLANGQDQATVDNAETELKRELAISPHDFLTYAALGKIAATAHRYAEAERYLKQAAAFDPRNPDAFLYMGQMEFDANHPAAAEADLRKAIALTTDPARNRYQIQKAHYLLGRILTGEHREQEARAEMQIARAFANEGLSQDKSELAGLLSNDAATTGVKGVSKDSSDSFQSPPGEADPTALHALEAFEKQLTPPIADSYNNLGVIAATGEHYAEALTYFEHAAAWDPAFDGLDLNRGRAAFMASRFSDAVAPLSRYVHAHPDDSGIRGALAMSQFMTQDYSGCLATLTGVETQVASIPQMQYVYAASLVKTGQVTQGREKLEALESAHPEIPEVHRELAEALALQGETQKAIREFQFALVLDANDAETHYAFGRLEIENRDAAAAITELQSAVRLSPDEPKFHRELAAAYDLAMRPDDAEKERQVYEGLKTAPASAADRGSPQNEKQP
jgi:tetratricopeptide (TPR) repeat protein